MVHVVIIWNGKENKIKKHSQATAATGGYPHPNKSDDLEISVLDIGI